MNKMLQFFSENKAALTSIGILLTFLISSISLYFSVRNNKAVHYVNAVTKNRVEWLYKFREYISALISTTTIENAELDAKDLDEYRKHMGRIEKLKYLIHMHLNFSDNIDGKIDGCRFNHTFVFILIHLPDPENLQLQQSYFLKLLMNQQCLLLPG